jgi:hypothetical protein
MIGHALTVAPGPAERALWDRWIAIGFAVEQGHMRASTAASLVGAAILSTTIFPLVGLRLRAGRAAGAPA